VPRILVCPLSRLDETIEAQRPSRIVTLTSPGVPAPTLRGVDGARHLVIETNDIASPREGLVAPMEAQVAALLAFAAAWDRAAPLLIHCYAGVSRSPAAAYVAMMRIEPSRDPAALAAALRRLSPTATPNPRIVALGDRLLARGGALSAAIAAIGRGEECYEGAPFALSLGA
jgi:predicted protein tyrosine phosphatase